jgi:hypothetical protein
MALFSITSRAVGETLTAAKYNSDRNEIVAGIAPDTIPSTESDIAHANATSDPGETGAESLSANLTGDLAHVKYIIEEMKGVSWRTSNTIRRCPMGQTNYVFATGYTASDNLTYQWHVHVPDGFVGTVASAMKVYLTCTNAGGGTAKMFYQYSIIRDDTVITSSGTTAADWVPATTNRAYLRTFTILANIFQAGDICLFQLGREGGNVADDNTGVVAFQGGYYEFTGKASRS